MDSTPLTLLCLPCAGASAMMYARWHRHLPDWVRLQPVELPGRGARWAEPYVEDFGALVTQLCQAHHGVAAAGAYALLGHSMGALLAWAMACRWRSEGLPEPRALWVSGCAAPARRDDERYEHKDTDAELVADLRDQGGTPEAVFESAELLRMTLDTLRADYRVCRSFVHQPRSSLTRPLNAPVYAWGGRQDSIETDRLQAWQLEAAKHFALSWFDGGHFFIKSQESRVLQDLGRGLGAARHGMVQGAAWPAARAVFNGVLG